MRQRQPRRKDNKHLAFIRQLPCVVCGDNTTVEAAHIRYGDPSILKPLTGGGTRADDMFTTPLCGQHHREQHEHNEVEWWKFIGLDPIKIALMLYIVSGDVERGEAIALRRNG